jgi:ABC-type spermidine/putrescine transport system permease subunit II
MKRRLLRDHSLTDVLSHIYIWCCLLVFVAPFFALVVHSVAGKGGAYALDNFSYVIGSFGENLMWSFIITGLVLVIDVAISLPAAYALMRFSFPGQRLLYSMLSLPLYVPAAVVGMALVLANNFTYHLTTSMWGLVFAMVVATFPLMLTPIMIALKDLPPSFEEAAQCLGATKWQSYWKVVFPLIGPGLSAGLMITFIIVFNEYLVTLFVHPPGLITAPLRVFNLVKTAGLAPSTTALAVMLQLISFVVVVIFLRVFGTRHFKGTYII